jgi:hypothetical protein
MLADPGERENLADREGEAVGRLRERLERWRSGLPSLETLWQERSRRFEGGARKADGSP